MNSITIAFADEDTSFESDQRVEALLNVLQGVFDEISVLERRLDLPRGQVSPALIGLSIDNIKSMIKRTI